MRNSGYPAFADDIMGSRRKLSHLAVHVGRTMNTSIVRVLLCGLLSSTSACVPILTHIDYVAEMRGGTLVKSTCWDKPSIEYRTHGITLTSRIMTWPDGVLRVEVVVDIPEGITAALLTTELSISTQPNVGTVRVPIPGISLNDNPSLPIQPIGPMVGHNVKAGTKTNPRHFWLFVPLHGIDTRDMRVTLPPMKINDRVVSIPEIHFARQVRVQLAAPLQC